MTLQLSITKKEKRKLSASKSEAWSYGLLNIVPGLSCTQYSTSLLFINDSNRCAAWYHCRTSVADQPRPIIPRSSLFHLTWARRPHSSCRRTGKLICGLNSVPVVPDAWAGIGSRERTEYEAGSAAESCEAAWKPSTSKVLPPWPGEGCDRRWNIWRPAGSVKYVVSVWAGSDWVLYARSPWLKSAVNDQNPPS